MIPKKRESFVSFLRRARRRDTPIGDLARDYCADHEWHKSCRGRPVTFEMFVARLDELHACDGAYESLEAADLEYRSQFDGLRAWPRECHPVEE